MSTAPASYEESAYLARFVDWLIHRYDYEIMVACAEVATYFTDGRSTASVYYHYRKWLNGKPKKKKPPRILPPDVHPTVIIKPPTIYGDFQLTRDTTVEAFISDGHWHPEQGQGHDEAVWEVVLLMLHNLQPDILFFGGDMLDLYAPSRYTKKMRLASPEAFIEELTFAKERVEELRNLLPNTRFVWLDGNHEDRLAKYIQNNAQFLEGLLELFAMLDLDSFDVTKVDDFYQIGRMSHLHGDKVAGGGEVNTARLKFQRILSDIIFGHHHKFSTWWQRRVDGSYYGAFGNATLQYLEVDYAKYPQWNHGITVIEYAKSGLYDLHQVLVHKPSVFSPKAEAVFQGKHFTVDISRAT